MRKLLLIFICIGLMGCLNEDDRQTMEIRKLIVKGRTTKQEVLDNLGEPISKSKQPAFDLPESAQQYISFDKNKLPPKLRGGELWSYTRIKTKKGVFFNLMESTYLMIFFDIDGVVSDYYICRARARY